MLNDSPDGRLHVEGHFKKTRLHLQWNSITHHVIIDVEKNRQKIGEIVVSVARTYHWRNSIMLICIWPLLGLWQIFRTSGKVKEED